MLNRRLKAQAQKNLSVRVVPPWAPCTVVHARVHRVVWPACRSDELVVVLGRVVVNLIVLVQICQAVHDVLVDAVTSAPFVKVIAGFFIGPPSGSRLFAGKVTQYDEGHGSSPFIDGYEELHALICQSQQIHYNLCSYSCQLPDNGDCNHSTDRKLNKRKKTSDLERLLICNNSMVRVQGL
jgi:hypothetical protein